MQSFAVTEESSMCLAIPGKVLNTFDQHGLRMGKVQFGGVVREARTDQNV